MMSQPRVWGNEVFATILLLKGPKCLFGESSYLFGHNSIFHKLEIIVCWVCWVIYLVVQLASFAVYTYIFSVLFSGWLVGSYSVSTFWWGLFLLGCFTGVIGGMLLGIVFAFTTLCIMYAGRPVRAILGDSYESLEYGDTFWTRPLNLKINISFGGNHATHHLEKIQRYYPITLKLAVALSALLSADRAEEWLGDTHEMVTSFQKRTHYKKRLLWHFLIETLILLRCALILKAIICSRNLDDLLPRKKK